MSVTVYNCIRSGTDFNYQVALLSTDYNQRAVTIDNGNKEPYPGWHGFFTWILFNFVRSKRHGTEASRLFTDSLVLPL